MGTAATTKQNVEKQEVTGEVVAKALSWFEESRDGKRVPRTQMLDPDSPMKEQIEIAKLLNNDDTSFKLDAAGVLINLKNADEDLRKICDDMGVATIRFESEHQGITAKIGDKVVVVKKHTKETNKPYFVLRKN